MEDTVLNEDNNKNGLNDRSLRRVLRRVAKIHDHLTRDVRRSNRRFWAGQPVMYQGRAYVVDKLYGDRGDIAYLLTDEGEYVFAKTSDLRTIR